MPDDRIKISDFSTPVSLNNDDVIVIVQNNGGVKTTYKAPLTLLATQLLKNMQFASDLETTNKAIIGAINEVAQGGGGASTLNDLTDVTITNPSNGQVITYNAQTGKWVNGAGAEITLVNTASGAIATFSDGAAGLPLKSLKVEIKPKQASGTPTPSSVLPISGTDTITIYQTGANLWDEDLESGSINTSTGQNETYGTDRMRSANYIPVQPSTAYYFVSKNNVSCYAYCYRKDKSYIGIYGGGSNIRNATITTPSDCYFIRFRTDNNYGTTYANDFSLNYPSTDTTYHAHVTATTKTVSLPSTVYGGEVDLIGGSGESNYTLANLSDLTWENAEQSGKTIFYAVIADKINNVDNIAYCEIFASATSSGTSLANAASLLTSDFMICTSKNTTSPRIYIRADGYTVTQFANTISGYKIAYQVATPTPITIANPIELTAKAGVNNVFGDTDGNTSVDYFNSIAGNVEELIELLLAQKEKILTGTLTAGSTSLTLTDSAITTTAMYDFYTDVYGVNPTAVTVSTGSMTLTFAAQQSDISVKVVIR